MCVDTKIDMRVKVCLDTTVGMCVPVCVDMCVDMHTSVPKSEAMMACVMAGSRPSYSLSQG